MTVADAFAGSMPETVPDPATGVLAEPASGALTTRGPNTPADELKPGAPSFRGFIAKGRAPLPGISPVLSVSRSQEASSICRNLLQRTRAAIQGRFSYALADQVVYSFGNMVVAALLARHAPARDFGIYILTQRTMDVLIQLCNTLSWAPFTFHLQQTSRERQRSYRGSVFLQQIVACLLATLAMAAVARWTATSARGVYHGTFAPLIFASGVILFREFNRRMYFAEMRMREAFWTELATVALQIAGVEWLYRTHRLDVPHTLFVLALGAGALGLWWLLREARTLRIHLRDAVADTRFNFRLGRWLLGSNFVFMASSQCNPWILSAVFGGGSVAGYAVCESVVNIPRVALVSLQNVFAPILSRAVAEGGKPLLREKVRRLDRLLLIGSAVCAAAIAVAGPWAARLIFRNVPGNARIILVLLGLNFVAFAATLAQSYALSAIDRAGPTFYANLAGLVVQAATVFYLVHHLRVPGAALAMLLGSLVVLAVRQFSYSREMGQPAFVAAMSTAVAQS